MKKELLSKINTISDFKVSILLFIIGFIISGIYITHYTGNPYYFQNRFGAAVMLTIGKGFYNPSLDNESKLSDFLQCKRSALSINDISKNIKVTQPDAFQNYHMYLLYMTALIWKLFGISWTNLFILSGILYGLTTALSYSIFRLGIRRSYSLLGSSFFVFSSMHLNNLPIIRDYSRTPFILAVILIFGYLATNKFSTKYYYLMSAICGAIIGIGSGFRGDVIILIPIFFIVIFLFSFESLKQDLIKKIIASILFVSSYFLVALPIIIANISAGGNWSHVILLGFSTVFIEKLGLSNTIYELLPLYNDTFLSNILNTYSQNHYHISVNLYTKEYEEIGIKYLLLIIKNFPADILLRAYASTLKIIEMPFVSFNGPLLINHQSVLKIYKYIGNVMTFFSGSSIYIVIISITGVCLKSIRKAILLSLLIVYLGSISSIQFSERQYFYLGFITIFCLLLILEHMPFNLQQFKIFKEIKTNEYSNKKMLNIERLDTSKIKILIIFITFTSITLLVSLYTLQKYQEIQVKRLIKHYINSDKKKVDFYIKDNGNNNVLINSKEFIGNEKENINHSTIMVIEFHGLNKLQTNSKLTVPISFMYHSKVPFFNFTQFSSLNLTNGIRYLYQPIFYGKIQYSPTPDQYSDFKGVEIKKDLLPYIKAIYKITNIKHIHLLLGLRLPLEWETNKMHLVFADKH